MTTDTGNQKRSAAIAVLQHIQQGLLSLLLAVVFAFVLAMVIPVFVPDFFGSCFEGSCGYAALFIFAPAATLVLTPVWWVALRRAGPLTCLILWFVLLVVSYFILGTALWLIGLAALSCSWSGYGMITMKKAAMFALFLSSHGKLKNKNRPVFRTATGLSDRMRITHAG